MTPKRPQEPAAVNAELTAVTRSPSASLEKEKSERKVSGELAPRLAPELTDVNQLAPPTLAPLAKLYPLHAGASSAAHSLVYLAHHVLQLRELADGVRRHVSFFFSPRQALGSVTKRSERSQPAPAVVYAQSELA